MFSISLQDVYDEKNTRWKRNDTSVEGTVFLVQSALTFAFVILFINMPKLCKWPIDFLFSVSFLSTQSMG